MDAIGRISFQSVADTLLLVFDLSTIFTGAVVIGISDYARNRGVCKFIRKVTCRRRQSK